MSLVNTYVYDAGRFVGLEQISLQPEIKLLEFSLKTAKALKRW